MDPYYDDEPEPWPDDWTEGPEWLQLLDELREESSRGRVLILAHFLDDFLSRALKAFLVENEGSHKLLDGFNAPLGTFSSRIAAAAALGLISELEYARLNAFRAARNAYAHSIVPDFGDKKVARAVRALISEYSLAEDSDPNFVVAYSGNRLSLDLLNRAAHVSKQHSAEGLAGRSSRLGTCQCEPGSRYCQV